MFFFTIGAIYLVYLVYLLFRAYSELRAMPYFGKNHVPTNLFYLSWANISVVFIMCGGAVV